MYFSKGDRRIRKLLRDGRELKLLLRNGRVFYRTNGPYQLQQLEWEVYDDGEDQWWQVIFYATEELEGSAADGWTDPRGYVVLRLERSEDLETWDHDYTDGPDSGTEVEPGIWMYVGRSPYPVASKTRLGQLSLTHATPNVLDNPIETVTIAGNDIALANLPYTLPDDVAVMQADLIAAGFIGSTVAAVGADGWEIFVPDVDFAGGYNVVSGVGWPPYEVMDAFGFPRTVSGRNFSVEAVNQDGIRTNVPKQFSRLRLTRGMRVLP